MSEAMNISVSDSELEKCDHMLIQLDADSSHDLLFPSVIFSKLSS